MKKFFLISTAIYLLLLALLGILSSLMSYFGLNARPEASLANFSPLYLLLIGLPFIGWLIATGVGLLLKKNWARYSILVMSGFAFLMGVIFCFVFIFMPASNAMNGVVTWVIKTVFVILSIIFLIILPIIYCIFFTRQSVKDLFLINEGTQSGLPRPVGIS